MSKVYNIFSNWIENLIFILQFTIPTHWWLLCHVENVVHLGKVAPQTDQEQPKRQEPQSTNPRLLRNIANHFRLLKVEYILATSKWGSTSAKANKRRLLRQCPPHPTVNSLKIRARLERPPKLSEKAGPWLKGHLFLRWVFPFPPPDDTMWRETFTVFTEHYAPENFKMWS